MSKKQKELFQVGWYDCREKLGADIEGDMTKSILECSKTLNCSCCGGKTVLDDIKTKKELKFKEEKKQSGRGGVIKQQNEAEGVETVKASREDVTILMELMMYQGRDINVVTLYNMFKTIHLKENYDRGLSDD